MNTAMNERAFRTCKSRSAECQTNISPFPNVPTTVCIEADTPHSFAHTDGRLPKCYSSVSRVIPKSTGDATKM